MTVAFSLEVGPRSVDAVIVTHDFNADAKVRAEPFSNMRDLVWLRRANLVQLCLLDDRVRSLMGFGDLRYGDVADRVFDEAVALVRDSARPTRLELDDLSRAGVVITYRGFDFLFVDHDDPLVKSDFIVYRPAADDALSGWPAVTSIQR